LIELLNKNTRGRIGMGRIDLMQNFSFFEVDEKHAQEVVSALNGKKFKGRQIVVELSNDKGDASTTSKRKGSSEGRTRRNQDENRSRRTSRKDESKAAWSDERPARKKEAAPAKRNKKNDYEELIPKKKQKPSREERGYTKARGRKDDWKQFFIHDNGGDLVGEEPDFNEPGWQKKNKKK